MENLREIAEIENLEYFETTSQMNGTPANLNGALKGFNSFEQAQKIAEKYRLNIESFEKSDGWQLWYRTGNNMYEPFLNTSNDYGDNYSEFAGNSITASEFFESEVKPELENFNNFDDLKKFIKEREELFSKIENAGENEIVITNYGTYYETIEKHSMYFYHDTHHYVIGLIEP